MRLSKLYKKDYFISNLIYYARRTAVGRPTSTSIRHNGRVVTFATCMVPLRHNNFASIVAMQNVDRVIADRFGNHRHRYSYPAHSCVRCNSHRANDFLETKTWLDVLCFVDKLIIHYKRGRKCSRMIKKIHKIIYCRINRYDSLPAIVLLYPNHQLHRCHISMWISKLWIYSELNY